MIELVGFCHPLAKYFSSEICAMWSREGAAADVPVSPGPPLLGASRIELTRWAVRTCPSGPDPVWSVASRVGFLVLSHLRCRLARPAVHVGIVEEALLISWFEYFLKSAASVFASSSACSSISS